MTEKKRKAKVLELSVVGLGHRVTRTTLHDLEKELPLKCYLKREPDNMHDENAVKVMVHPDNDFRAPNWHIGYLRRDVAAVFAPKMDDGSLEVLDCDLTSIDLETYREGELRLVVSSEREMEIGT